MAIIGISGKKQHGKDTVAKIIQYLIATKDHPIFSEGKSITNLSSYNFELYSTWKIKRFADKLKDIVCLLINCTREQLEDNSFKEKELGEEWRIYRVLKDIGFGAELIKIYNTQQEATQGVYKIGMLAYQDSIILTPRLILQLLGTECGRQIIHPNIWINALMSEYRATNELQCWDSEGRISPIFPNWIITDCRFPNELKAIEDKGGVVIRVERNFFNRPVSIQDTHESEIALDSHKFKYTIMNDGTIDNLIEMIKTNLEILKII